MSGRVVLVVGAVLVAVAAGLALLFTLGETDGSSAGTIPPPRIEGAPLAAYDSAVSPDPGVGQPAPQVSGSDFDRSEVQIRNDGRPKVVLFLAHWCPHCQAEVPRVQEWLDAGGKPNGVDFYSVATSIDPGRPNHPPEAWLTAEGWTAPVVVDTGNEVSAAYGLTSFPYWVFIGSDGMVAWRVSGELPPDALTDLFSLLLQ